MPVANLVMQLRRDEGCRLKPYKDTVGKLTIGVGFNLDDVGLFDEEIDFILTNRINKLRAQLQAYPFYSTLDPIRQAVIENMAYNVGIANLLHFVHFLAALAKRNWTEAAEEMLNSAWAQQLHYNPQDPAASRPGRLAQQILSGAWQ